MLSVSRDLFKLRTNMAFKQSAIRPIVGIKVGIVCKFCHVSDPAIAVHVLPHPELTNEYLVEILILSTRRNCRVQVAPNQKYACQPYFELHQLLMGGL